MLLSTLRRSALASSEISPVPCMSVFAAGLPNHNLKPAAFSHYDTSRRPGARLRVAQPSSQPVRSEPKVDALATVEEEPSPFFEPLVRTFMLGIAAGWLCELLHVSLTFTGFATSAGASLPSLLPEAFEMLAPAVLWDHIAAISSWLGFYIIEAWAIMAVLRQYPDDTAKAVRMISNVSTLSQKLLPVKLSAVKTFVYKLVKFRGQTGAAAVAHTSSAFTGGAGVPTLPGPGPSGVGTSVLDRPVPVPMPDIPGFSRIPGEDGETGLPGLHLPQPTPEGQGSTASNHSARKPQIVLPPKKRPGLKPGQWDPSQGLPVDKREKELQERRSFLKNFWYAAALSTNLKDRPLRVDIFGRTIVLFRDANGTAKCLDNVCPHRGAPLSEGWVKDVEGHSCVVCPYHGWAFDSNGCLKEVPSAEPGSTWPKRPLVDAYPVKEQGGFIWLFFGSSRMPAAERPPIPDIPELHDPNWRAVYGEIEFDSPHWSVFDNAIDMAHIHYLHNDSFGNQGNPVIHGMVAHQDTWSCGTSFRIHNKPVSPLWEWTKVPEVPVEAKAFLPSTSMVRIQLGGGVSMITFVNTVPIDGNRSINRFCLIRNFALTPMFDNWARNSMFRILGEDKVMVEKLKPEDMRVEVSLQPDLPQIAFRKLRQGWIDMGYGVQPEEVKGHKGSLDM